MRLQGHTQNLGPIGSAVLTFIGYKQTDKQTSKVYIKYIDDHIKCDWCRLVQLIDIFYFFRKKTKLFSFLSTEKQKLFDT